MIRASEFWMNLQVHYALERPAPGMRERLSRVRELPWAVAQATPWLPPPRDHVHLSVEGAIGTVVP